MYAELNDELRSLEDGNDSIVIKKYIEGIEGGRTLDVSDSPATKVFQGGHVVIFNATTKTYKPMPITSAGIYDSLPQNYNYIGVLQRSVLAAKPFAAIMVRGTVNEAASPYPVTEAMKTALKHIIFRSDI